MPKPNPIPDELTQPFWDACNQRQLVLQNCTKCDKLQYPPKPRCTICGSADNLEWKEVEGKGHIMEAVVIHDSRIRLLREEQPLNFAIVTLDQDPGINLSLIHI